MIHLGPLPRSIPAGEPAPPRGPDSPASRPTRSPFVDLAVACVCVLPLVLAGCAGTGGSPADRLVLQGDYSAAVVAYEAEAERAPDDPQILRNHGIALFHAGRREQAIEKLARARSLAPEDERALYFLGRAAEETGRIELALASYTEYLARSDRDARTVRAKVQELAVRQATAEASAALARERELDARAIPENTVAVPEFENALRDPELDVLRYGLASVLITDLSRVSALRVLERERLSALLGELALASPETAEATEGPAFAPLETVLGTKQRLAVLIRPGTGMAYYGGLADEVRSEEYAQAVRDFQRDQGLAVDGVPGRQTWSALDAAVRTLFAAADMETERPAVERARVTKETAPRIGALLGARRFVQGTFAPLGSDDIQLGASLLEIASGGLTAAGEPVVGPRQEVLRLEKRLVYGVLDALGVEPTPEEREEIDRLPTDSFLAFLAYSRGLYLEDLGRTQDALGAYLEALRADPGFAAAQEKEAVLTTTSADEMEFDRTVLEGSVGGSGPDTADRLTRTGSWSGLGPGPETDRSDETDLITPVGEIEVGTTIVIEGDLPGGSR